jgi:hypothetical protein
MNLFRPFAVFWSEVENRSLLHSKELQILKIRHNLRLPRIQHVAVESLVGFSLTCNPFSLIRPIQYAGLPEKTSP